MTSRHLTFIPLTPETLRLKIEAGAVVTVQPQQYSQPNQRWEAEAPALVFPADKIEAFRAGENARVELEDPRAPAPLGIMMLRGGVYVLWKEGEYAIDAEAFVAGITAATLDRPAQPTRHAFVTELMPEREVEDFRELPVREGFTLRIERRKDQCWIFTDDSSKPGHGSASRLTPNFDVDDWSMPHKWLTQGGCAICQSGTNRVTLYSHGNTKQGELRLSDLCAAILAMGGQTAMPGKRETNGEALERGNRERGEGDGFW